MALVKFGGGIAGISGSIGGVTYARNRYGSYMRQRTVPVDPKSPRQLAARNNLQAVSQDWNASLDAAQRAAWDTYARNINVLNKLGETINLTGYNMFCRTNCFALAAGISIIDDGPVIQELAPSDPSFDVAISAAAQELSVTFDNTQDWANEAGGVMAIYQGSPRQNTRNFFDGPYRLLGTIDGDAVTAPTSPATIAVDYPVAEGQIVSVQARIMMADGRLSNPFRVDATVAV